MSAKTKKKPRARTARRVTGAAALTPSGRAVREALAASPKLPSQTLARRLYHEHPALWNSVKNCYDAVRYHRGERSAGWGRSKSPVSVRTASARQEALKQWRIPKSDSVDYVPLMVESRRNLVISDIHFPYHDRQALLAALNTGQAGEPDCVILNGDVLDFYQLSRWVRDPRLRSFKEEVEMGREFLAQLRENFPKARLIWKLGNHEDRYDIYMRTKAPELLGLDDFDMATVMHADKHGVEIVGHKRVLMVGKLPLIHGHEYVQSIIGPVNAARGMFLKAKGSVMCGHWHHTSEHAERRITGEQIVAWSVGCLCDLSPEYAPLNRWNHGFAFVDVSSDQSYEVRNKRVMEGKVV